MTSDHDVRRQLPYAFEYLEESIFPGPMSGAHLPYRWRRTSTGSYSHPSSANSDERYILHTSCRGLYSPEVTGQRTHESSNKTKHTSPYDDGSWQPIYWEITISDVIPIPGCSFAMGLSDSPLNYSFNAPDLAEYSYDGIIRVTGRSNQASEPYRYGDIVGCGFSPRPHAIFFTRNGRLVYESRLGIESCLRPRPIISVYEHQSPHAKPRKSRRLICANFGQTPFRFDINSHFHFHFERTRVAASNIPGETLVAIIEALFQLAFNEPCGWEELQHVFQVSEYWRKLCSRLQHPQLTLRTFNDLDSICLEAGNLNLNFGALVVREDSRSPWIHRFFVSRLLPRLSSIASWTWSGKNFGDIYSKLPPRVASLVPSLVRNTFHNVRVLVLPGCSLFSRWIDLAKFVLALPALDQLYIDNEEPTCWTRSWRNEDPLPESPPKQLRFVQRLEHFRISHHGPFVALWAWLFLIGEQHSLPKLKPTNSPIHPRNLTLSPKDVVVVSKICRELHQIHPTSGQCLTIHYEVISDTCCCLTSSCDDMALLLKFEKHDSFYQLQAIKITYKESEFHRWRSSYKFTHHNIPESLRSALEGSLTPEGCSCEIDFRCPDCHPEQMMLEVYQNFSLRGVRLFINGKTDASVDWMSTRSPSFKLKSQWVGGKPIVVSWDTSEVKPGTRPIPWIKLFSRYRDNESYVNDVTKDIDPYGGKAEFLLPNIDKTETDRWYFLMVGDYRYRTSLFQIHYQCSLEKKYSSILQHVKVIW